MRAHDLESQSRSGTRKVFEMILILIAKTDNQIEYYRYKTQRMLFSDDSLYLYTRQAYNFVCTSSSSADGLVVACR